MSTQIIIICLALATFYLIDFFRCKKKKCKKLLFECQKYIKKNKKRFSDLEIEGFYKTINSIKEDHNLKEALKLKKQLEQKKTFFEKSTDFLKGWAIPIILVFGIIKPMWFELMQIPTGSMRPTFKEYDALAISKLQFGTNIPMTTKHLMFDDNEVKRMGIVTFTSENLPGDNSFKYFNIVPGFKQLTKRITGIGGDSIYYYGGRLYGVDKNGVDISDKLQLESLKHIEHIPFIGMQGRFEQFNDTSFVLKQSGQNIAEITFNPFSGNKTKMLDNIKKEHDIYNLWGIEGFAKFRIVKKDEIQKSLDLLPSSFQGSDFYLELTHHPSIHNSTINLNAFFYPIVNEQKSYLPLKGKHLVALQKALYTARFIVNDGIAKRYEYEPSSQSHPVKLENIEDGTYEFFYGQGYKIGWQGISKKLDEDHPLMNLSKENLLQLVNLGIEFDTRFSNSTSPLISSSRYAYYRDGDLYAMGGKIFDKDDESLIKFQAYEKRKEEINNNDKGFLDPGAPVDQNGKLDKEKVLTYGLKIPNDHYLMLGDNHAMSGDSREFGPVPKENIRGAPTFIFWGPNERFGSPLQPAYKIFTKPRMIVWGLVSCGFIIYLIITKRKKKLN